MKIQPLVSLITVNYNQAAVTAAMLRSLSLLNYSNYEVIVVDNASSESSAYLQDEFPFIRYVVSPVNTGFAGGNNIGLRYARGKYAFFLNNDTEVTPILLDELVSHMQTYPKCGIACPKIKYHSKPDTIQYAGTVGPAMLTCRSYDIGYMQQDNGSYDDTCKTDQPNGAAMLVPMKLIKEVGAMSEMFFLYYEELDWAAQFKRAGYEIHYVGSATIFHKESVSTGKHSAFKTFYLYRNRLLFIRRNFSALNCFVSAAYFTLIAVPVHVVKHSLKGEWQHVQSIVKALWWNVTHRAFANPKKECQTNLNSECQAAPPRRGVKALPRTSLDKVRMTG